MTGPRESRPGQHARLFKCVAVYTLSATPSGKGSNCDPRTPREPAARRRASQPGDPQTLGLLVSQREESEHCGSVAARARSPKLPLRSR